MDLAKDENNTSAIEMLNWFVDEQEEEEETFTNVLHRIDTGESYDVLDKEFAKRDVKYEVQFYL